MGDVATVVRDDDWVTLNPSTNHCAMEVGWLGVGSRAVWSDMIISIAMLK